MDSHSLLSPVRAPTVLAEERSAISAANLDATSAMSKNPLGSSLRPQRLSDHPVTDVVVTDEAVFISSCQEELKNLGDVDFFRKKC